MSSVNNYSSYRPIIYSIVLIFGIFLGKNLIKNEDYGQLNYLNELIKNNYVDTINIEKINEQIFQKMLSELDPHSTYISKKSFQQVDENMRGSFSGIGIEFSIIRDTVVVVAAISGGPSYDLGIQAGDKIIEVDNVDFCYPSISNSDVVNKLRGEKGTFVDIKILRPSTSKQIDYRIKRNDIPLVSIDSKFMINDSVGIIKINRFSATTFDEFNSSIENLLSKKMSHLVLDLRGNPGGYLDASINICNHFFNEGTLLVYTEGNKRKRRNYFSDSFGKLQKTKLIVLIDEGSASASEILAGAIQDNDRGIIIGRKSFGKGLVQEEIRTKDGGAIRLTTQRYFTPSGRFIQKPYKSQDSLKSEKEFLTIKGRKVLSNGGITPDVIVPVDSSLNFSIINLALVNGSLRDFCFDYASIIRSKGVEISEDNFNSQFNIQEARDEFVKKYELQEYITKLGKIESEYLNLLITASIGRNLMGDYFYHKTLSTNDDFIESALKKFNSWEI